MNFAAVKKPSSVEDLMVCTGQNLECTTRLSMVFDRGNLLNANENMLQATKILDSEFNIMHGTSLSNGKHLFKTLAECTLSNLADPSDIPYEVILCLARTRTYIRLRDINLNLLSLKTTVVSNPGIISSINLQAAIFNWSTSLPEMPNRTFRRVQPLPSENRREGNGPTLMPTARISTPLPLASTPARTWYTLTPNQNCFLHLNGSYYYRSSYDNCRPLKTTCFGKSGASRREEKARLKVERDAQIAAGRKAASERDIQEIVSIFMSDEPRFRVEDQCFYI
nr:unnamed protein product [Callosobruchus chinensis]